jgi:hypothetical protein
MEIVRNMKGEKNALGSYDSKSKIRGKNILFHATKVAYRLSQEE